MTTRWPCAAIVSLCGLLALAAPAWAEQGYLASTAGDWIPLWSSPVVVREGTDLETAGQFDLAVQRMACLVDNGTRVIGTFAGGSPGVPGGVSRIVVIEGEATGCTGYVSSILYFRPAPESNRKPASPCWTTKPEIASSRRRLMLAIQRRLAN